MWSYTQEGFRRMVVLSSIHASLVKCSADDLDCLSEVNAEFKLDKDVKVLRFPTLLAPLVWKNLPEQEANADGATDDITPIISKIPSWLRWGSFEELEREVRLMVQYCQQHPRTPQ